MLEHGNPTEIVDGIEFCDESDIVLIIQRIHYLESPLPISDI